MKPISKSWQYLPQHRRVPKGKIVIWFDDGYLSTYKVAFPVLRELKMKGVVAVITDRVGKTVEGKKYMNVDQLKTLVRYGWVMASHSVHHDYGDKQFKDLDRNRTDWEARISRKWIVHHLNVVPYIFVVPHNYITHRQAKILKRYYSFARTFMMGVPCGHVVFHDIKVSKAKFKDFLLEKIKESRIK